MKKFLLGFVTCWYLTRHQPKVIQVLQQTIAKLELKQDILKHDNPNIKD